MGPCLPVAADAAGCKLFGIQNRQKLHYSNCLTRRSALEHITARVCDIGPNCTVHTESRTDATVDPDG